MEQKEVDFQAIAVAGGGTSYSQESKWEKWERKKAG